MLTLAGAYALSRSCCSPAIVPPNVRPIIFASANLPPRTTFPSGATASRFILMVLADMPATDSILDAYVAEALERLRQAIAEGSESVPGPLRDGQLKCIAYRDELIRRLRTLGPGGGRSEVPDRLDEANVVLSLLAAVEYPLQGFRKRIVEQAIQALADIRRRHGQ